MARSNVFPINAAAAPPVPPAPPTAVPPPFYYDAGKGLLVIFLQDEAKRDQAEIDAAAGCFQ